MRVIILHDILKAAQLFLITLCLSRCCFPSCSPPVQVCGHGFNAGELGPGTIVGSAAFNMFVIIGICVWTIPTGESRKIKHLRVFFITAFWSIFAYIWLYLILSVMSPGVVEVRRAHARSFCAKRSLSHKHEAERERWLSQGGA